MIPTPAEFLTQYGYLGVFLSVFILRFFIPVPEDVIILTAGLLGGQIGLQLPFIIICAWTGGFLGSLMLYYVLKHQRWTKRFLKKYVYQGRIKKYEAKVKENAFKVLFTARLIPGSRLFSPILASQHDIPFKTFALAELAGGTIIIPSMATIGFFAPAYVPEIGSYLTQLGTFVQVIIYSALGILALYLIWLYIQRTIVNSSEN